MAHVAAFTLLTMITQVGGIIYLITLLLTWRLRIKVAGTAALFTVFYLLSTFLVVPRVAALWDREPLPLSGNLAPATLWFCILNRHYTTATLKKELQVTADEMSPQFGGCRVHYLDANFPFMKFPLIPHLSHNDGKKVDLAFCYLDGDGKPTATLPSAMVYGVVTPPMPGEVDFPTQCERKGFRQYNLMANMVGRSSDLSVDVQRTGVLLRLLAGKSIVSKIFVEPHLKSRWGLADLDKLRFHGCHAVRHDDHIHVQTY